MNTIAPTIVATRDELLELVPWNAVIAELGVFTGAFANTILRVCEPAELHLVDTWDGRMECGDKDGENVQTVEDMAVVYLALALRGDSRYTLHRAKTIDALKQFADYYFDFIYVDTDSSESEVYNNLMLSMRKVLWGIGVIERSEGARRAIDMFCADWRWDVTHVTKDCCPSYLLRPPQ